MGHLASKSEVHITKNVLGLFQSVNESAEDVMALNLWYVQDKQLRIQLVSEE